MAVNNTIIPTRGFPLQKGETPDLEAIIFWVMTGFFPANDTFWKDQKWDLLDFNKEIWHYKPRDITLEEAVEEFAYLMHSIVKRELACNDIILPLSGGLDSRTLAVAVNHLDMKAYTYSYRFQGSFHETKYGKSIAATLGWDFDAFDIPQGYLWNKIEEAAKDNLCYSEFSHARQVAVVDEVSKKGNKWLLGHWGDVLFDDMGVDDQLAYDQQKAVLKSKIIKPGGIELGKSLWSAWGLQGDIHESLDQRLDQMYRSINIQNANARIRAFKSLYWATRWTSTNLIYFDKKHPMCLPYYDDDMCRFVMSVPEKFLSGRRIQIEYIKRYGGELAEIEWQDKKPYNLHNYHKFRTKAHLPYRIGQAIRRKINSMILSKRLILRNWENQFLQADNPQKLEEWLFQNPDFKDFIPQELVKDYYQKFLTEDSMKWSHAISMLLTLSVFTSQNDIKT